MALEDAGYKFHRIYSHPVHFITSEIHFEDVSSIKNQSFPIFCGIYPSGYRSQVLNIVIKFEARAPLNKKLSCYTLHFIYFGKYHCLG